MDRILTITPERCIACGKCELACADRHTQQYDPRRARVTVYRRGPELGTPVLCLQCDDAACVRVCETRALVRNEATGAIDVVHERCIRCRACVGACPFGNMAWDEPACQVAKCDVCQGRPACALHCPTGAIQYRLACEAMRP